MKKIELTKGVYWVGAIDRDIKHFHGHSYTTPRGTTYNAYLIVDDKNVLVDAVLPSFADEMFARIVNIMDPKKIDYVVANHVEMDHSGGLPAVMEMIPQAKVFCTAKGKEGFSKYYSDKWGYHVVKTGDEISIGKKTLKFMEAPMIHWPDSMFTYIKEDGLLMPNDAFGQHLASDERYDDEIDEEVLKYEASKYYANILLPLSRLIAKKLDEIKSLGLPIKMIAPSHGIIWRKDISWPIEAYTRWSSGEAEVKIVVVYDTMYGSTKSMAEAIVKGIREEGAGVSLYNFPESDHSHIINEVMESKGLIIGSATIHNDILPSITPFMNELRTLRPMNKIGACFGSRGWAGGALKVLGEGLKAAGAELIESGLDFQYKPTEEELNKCIDFGRQFARTIKES